MKQTLFPFILAIVTIASCGQSQSPSETDFKVYNEILNQPGDSTIYGLACEGCTDSVIVFLPFSGSDPDTLNILDARINQQIFGRPKIGDQLAVIKNHADKTVADIIINLDELKGQWCYLVQPQLRSQLGNMTGDGSLRTPSSIPDSLLKKWLKPLEYGFEIRPEYEVYPVGVRQKANAEQGPVEYPKAKRYREWHIFNGHLLLYETHRDTLGNQLVTSIDTTDFVLLRRDSLVLRFSDHQQHYYRKKGSGI